MKPQWEEHTVQCPADLIEALSAELFELGFEGIWEDEDLLHAYIPHEKIKQGDIEQLCTKYGLNTDRWVTEHCEEINWNAEWEKNYQPVPINDKLSIRAHFHPVQPTPLEIVITPKMSFGTGHHATTFLIADHLSKRELLNKDVLDMGCGTGILAILAKKQGAANVTAVDYDPNAVENAIENVKYNGCESVKVLCSSLEKISGEHYDLILSNITRNINLSFISQYAKMLNKGGELMLSGFYTNDVNALVAEANSCGLNFVQTFEKENWSLLILNNT